MAKCREAAREVKPLIVKMISGDTINYIAQKPAPNQLQVKQKVYQLFMTEGIETYKEQVIGLRYTGFYTVIHRSSPTSNGELYVWEQENIIRAKSS